MGGCCVFLVFPSNPIHTPSMTSKVSKATLPGYYQLGDESNGYVIPESCLKSQNQANFLSNCTLEIEKKTALPKEITPKSIAERGSDIAYYSLLFWGKHSQIRLESEIQDPEEWIKELDSEIRKIWTSKGYPIPEFQTTINRIHKVEIYVFSISYTLSEGEKTLISQCVETPIGTPYYIVGEIKCFIGMIEYLKHNQGKKMEVVISFEEDF